MLRAFMALVVALLLAPISAGASEGEVRSFIPGEDLEWSRPQGMVMTRIAADAKTVQADVSEFGVLWFGAEVNITADTTWTTAVIIDSSETLRLHVINGSGRVVFFRDDLLNHFTYGGTSRMSANLRDGACMMYHIPSPLAGRIVLEGGGDSVSYQRYDSALHPEGNASSAFETTIMVEHDTLRTFSEGVDSFLQVCGVGPTAAFDISITAFARERTFWDRAVPAPPPVALVVAAMGSALLFSRHDTRRPNH